MSGPQADDLILTACPEAIALCASAFDRAYQAWRASLVAADQDFLPYAPASSERLFQAFVQEVRSQS